VFPLPDRLKPGDPADRDLHNHIVDELRHKVYAHTDAGSPRRGVATYDVLIAFGAGAMGQWLVEIEPTESMKMWELARLQRGKFWYEMRDLGQSVRSERGVDDLSEDLSGAIMAIVDAGRLPT